MGKRAKRGDKRGNAHAFEFLEPPGPLLQGRLFLDGKHGPLRSSLPVVGHFAVQLVGRGSLAALAVGVGDDPVASRPRVHHHDRGIRQGSPAWCQRRLWLPGAAGGRGRGAALAVQGGEHPAGAVPRARALLDLLREAQARTVLRSRRGDASVVLGARRRVGSVARRLGV